MSRWPVPRSLGGASSVDPLDDGHCSQHLALMWSALPDPDGFRAVLPPMPRDPRDPQAQAGWWTPLVHLARFGLGLAYPAAELGQLICDGAGGDDATGRALRLIELWWGRHVEDFLAWGTAGGDRHLLAGVHWPLDPPGRVPTSDTDSGHLHRIRQSPRWQQVWGGGFDPLHLSLHTDHPLSGDAPVHVRAQDSQLVLEARTYGGWYRALLQLADLAPPEGTTATVTLRGFGELGTYALQPRDLPRLCGLPSARGGRSAEPRTWSAPGRQADHPAPDRTSPSSASSASGEPLVATVLRRAVSHLRAHPGTRFVLDVPSLHWDEGAYTQAMCLPDGRIYAEVPSDQFLTPPLHPEQRKFLAGHGWSDPDDDSPNHWREWAEDVEAGAIATELVQTLDCVYGMTAGEFRLAPASLGAQILPDDVDITLGHDDGEEAGGDGVAFRAWLAAVEGASVPSPTAVALSVARCVVVEAARAHSGHPCRPIVTLQPSAPEQFQVPEAWAGNITAGRIVFISSNPSISEAGDHQSGAVAEEYPTAAWADEDVADFITHRFDSAQGWATPDGRFRRKDGTLSPKRVAFWNNVRRRAGELLEREASPAEDYAMTEVVHCKSKGEYGVSLAATTCADRHMDSVLALSPAELVVVLGQRSRTLLADLWPLGPDFGLQKGASWQERDNMALVTVGGRQRLLVYLWHPTGSTAPKTFAGAYPVNLERLRKLVRGDLSAAEVRDGVA